MGESFTIQISSNLVNRLTEDGNKLKKKTKKPKQKIPEGQQAQTKPQLKQRSNGPEMLRNSSGAVWPLQSPLFLPASPPPCLPAGSAELDAIRSVLQEGERVLDRLHQHGENIVQEVTQKAKELHDKEFKLPNQKPMPCLAEKQACLDCYRENAKDPLKCGSVVKTFADCTRTARRDIDPQLVGNLVILS